MAQHARTSSALPQLKAALSSAHAWHDARPRASLGSVRGWLWVFLISALFFWMSNPLVFVPGFHLSLEKSVMWTAIVLLVTLPWARVPRVPWPWVVFHVVTYASFLWTIDPHLTGYTSLLYLKISLVAVAVAANCEPAVVCWGLGLGGTVVVGLSIYAYNEQMWGSTNVFYGGIAGVGTNENILAYTLNVSLAAILAARPTRRPGPLMAWGLVVAANLYGIYLADSGTGFITALALLIALAVTVTWPRWGTLARHHLLLGLSALLTVLLGGIGIVVTILSKEFATFSGRVPYWRAAWESTMETAPLLGSGWGAVWTHPWSMVPPNDVAQDIYDRAGIALSHGHNFFIDVLPELGLLGLALAVLMLGYAIREVIRNRVHDRAAEPMAGRLILLLLIALLVSGITEPMLTVPLGWWSLLLAVALSRQRVLRARAAEHVEPGDEDRAPSLEATGARNA